MLKEILKEIIPIKARFMYRRIENEMKRPDEKKLLNGNERFKDIHKGKRCFIIGNGPSINKVDFTSLSQEITFTVNQISRMKNFTELKSNYHLWADERFFDLDVNKQEDLELIQVMKSVNSENNHPLVFYKTKALSLIKKFELDKDLDIAYFMDSGNIIASHIELPITRCMPSFPTVIHYAIYTAVYMGIKEIYLLGCDCTGILSTIQARMDTADKMAYSYHVTENERRRMARISQMTSIYDELTWFTEMFEIYEVIYKYCNRKKVKIVNLTEGSLLDLIPKGRLEEVLKSN